MSPWFAVWRKRQLKWHFGVNHIKENRGALNLVLAEANVSGLGSPSVALGTWLLKPCCCSVEALKGCSYGVCCSRKSEVLRLRQFGVEGRPLDLWDHHIWEHSVFSCGIMSNMSSVIVLDGCPMWLEWAERRQSETRSVYGLKAIIDGYLSCHEISARYLPTNFLRCM
jgi:hypothetical protein